MAKEFKLEDPGEGIHEVEIQDVLVSAGDTVSEGDAVFKVESDKAVIDLPSPYSGTIKEIKVSTGEVVEVGSVLLTIGNGEDSGDAEETSKDDEAEDKRDKDKEGQEDDEDEEEEEEDDEEEKGKEKKKVKKKAKAGSDGAAQTEEQEPEDESSDAPNKQQAAGEKDETADREEDPATSDTPVPTSPATRRIARELDIDLHEVEGSGPGGRVLKEDVQAYAGGDEKEETDKKAKDSKEPESKTSDSQPAPGAKPPPLPDFSKWGNVERVPLKSIRRSIARQMSYSWSSIPHVTHMDEVDITDLEAFRRAHTDAAEEAGGKLTLTAFAMKAAVVALKEFPYFNASLDAENQEVILKDYQNIGVALDTERGLLVPVIKHVEQKSVLDLAVEVKELADRLRSEDASPDDLRGGTFTITNVGALGGTNFTPIINYPQVAILGMAAASLKPVVRGDLDDYSIEPRLILPVSLTFDHRVVDGAQAARFMNSFKATLCDTDSLLLKG